MGPSPGQPGPLSYFPPTFCPTVFHCSPDGHAQLLPPRPDPVIDVAETATSSKRAGHHSLDAPTAALTVSPALTPILTPAPSGSGGNAVGGGGEGELNSILADLTIMGLEYWGYGAEPTLPNSSQGK